MCYLFVRYFSYSLTIARISWDNIVKLGFSLNHVIFAYLSVMTFFFFVS